MMMSKKSGDNRTILATTSSFNAALPPLRQKFRLVANPWKRKLTEDELLALLEEHRPVGLLAGTEPVTRRVLAAAQGYLRVVSRVGAGWDNVDHEAAGELRIRVYRTVGVLTQAVAELTLGLILAALRSIALQDRMTRQGKWQKLMGGLLQGKTVGIIGFGAIGRRVGELARAFDCRIIYFDPQASEVDWAERASLQKLLEKADIITVHASGKEMILGPQELQTLGKREVILVNTARGELIDEDALHSCLIEGQIGFACLDVFGREPYQGPLCAVDKVVLTPHIGSYAREARQMTEEAAIRNLFSGLDAAGVL